tara:strand:+ start:1648 stop:2004 length:357 start_codon:yes stop_codon:yes gene_type:complete
MIYDKFDALISLKPNVEFTWTGTDYSGLVGSDKPTESEIDTELARLNNLEPMRLLRLERDRRLTDCDWTQSRDLTLSNDDAWKTYRQALRDLPASASPSLNSLGNLDLTSVTWPTEPS